MSEEILGFKLNSAKTEKDLDGFTCQYLIGAKDLVLVVSKEQYDSVCKAYDNEIALLKEQLENKKGVSLEWLKERCKEVSKEQAMIQDVWDDGHLAGYNQALRNLLLAAEKEAKKK